MIRIQSAKIFKKILAKTLVGAMIMSSIITVGPSMSATAAAKKPAPAISNKVSSILVGKKFDLNIKNKIKGTYKWNSTNKKVATVNNMGLVTAIKKGTVTITCIITAPKATYKLSNKIVVRDPAKSIVINNKITTVNVGQTYDLNRTLTPKTSSDTTTWTSSDSKIVKLGIWGAFTALAEGTVTITGKTLSGKTDKVTITVVDKFGTVTTQEELEKYLGSGVSVITIKTDKEVNFTIPEGNYKKQALVVDAPNADVTNKGEFKSVEIKAVKENTWYEEAIGNTITVTAGNARVVVAENATVSIVVKNDKTVLTIVNNGVVEEIVLDSKAEIVISGTSKKAISVSANVAGAKIKTSVPLDLVAAKKISLTIQPGAESTKVTVENEDAIPEIIGNGTFKIQVGLGDNTVTKQVVAVPETTGVVSGGNTPGTPTPTETTVTVNDVNDNGVFTLPVDYKNLKSVVVKYNSDSYSVDGAILTMLTAFLSNSTSTINTWKSTTSASFGGATVVGEPESATKTVTFKSKVYTVTVNGTTDAATVEVVGPSGTPFVLSKGSDNKTLTITNAPASLSFVVTY